ncbi:MAG: non-canonical purine NTP pyrophosphatase [Minicystis sp.]
MPTLHPQTRYFCSSNDHKQADVERIFTGSPFRIGMLRQTTAELLSYNLDEVVKAKALEAYRRAMVPLFVEHGGLFIDHWSNLPGPLVKPFWETMGGRLCAMFSEGTSRRAFARSVVCYCDGKSLVLHEGRVEGRIAEAPRGEAGFHWDPVFIPDGQTAGDEKTLAEMGATEKLEWTGSGVAYRKLRAALESG